ncbi:D-alanyl-D-alanine carboxypeptidase family protein [Roseovarius sp. TE539]|uniref:D-alanyl-D-alanine carboxypeptidase family protein n=1 Tax=Roseovarius sp. TE539 TaxID=2249812 RepID=UPI0015EF55FC
MSGHSLTSSRRHTRLGVFVVTAFWLLVLVPLSAASAPYAAMVMDARSGEILHSENADTRLHPASLTKMMTLYIVFEAVENGEIGLDDPVRISRHAASEPPSKLGLRAGQTIRLRYLIRAAAVKSANDAATALAEAIEGSEARFARRMNRTARAMGMSRTTFRNAHGLTENGHLSTAHDMTILGRHVFYDYPDYYNLFSRISANTGMGKVYHTNRKLLRAYRGADGIKTGYTRAAGFNLVASAERGGERVIATVFGGRSTRTRNARVKELLDLGFRAAPSRVALRTPPRPPYMGRIGSGNAPGAFGRKVRLTAAAAVRKSLRPRARPLPEPPVIIADKAGIEKALNAARIETAKADPVKPAARPADLVREASKSNDTPRIVTRLSTSGGRNWGINVGRYGSRYQARKVLLATALNEITTLDGALRKVSQSKDGYDANFMGLTREKADLACRRLQAKKITCFMIHPGDGA